MSSAPIQRNPNQITNQEAAQLQPQPNLMPAQTAPAAPRLLNVEVPEDPRGTKRSREGNEAESDQPVVKCARTDKAEMAWEKNQRALFEAISAGDVAQAEKLLRHFPHLRDSQFPNHFGHTPLCLAAVSGRLDIVGLLVRCGASVDATAKCGTTPLIFAAKEGHVEVITTLCLLGAKPNAINQNGGLTALCVAARGKHIEACKHLIAYGACIDHMFKCSDSRGRHVVVTPLHYAVWCDFTDLIAWMIDTGKINVDRIEVSSNRPLLYLAARHGSLGLIRMLIERGANQHITVDTPGGKMSLTNVWDIAAYYSRCDSIEQLISLGLRPPEHGVWKMDVSDSFEFSAASDVMNHLSKAHEPQSPADKLECLTFRDNPWTAIGWLAWMLTQPCQDSITTVSVNLLSGFGWLKAPFTHTDGLKKLNAGRRLLGMRSLKTGHYNLLKRLSLAQMEQRLVEHFSVTLCSSEYTNPFSGLRLSSQGEQRMNQIAEAQSALLLKGVAHFREQFGQRVATLPSVCVDTYITLTHKVNKPDLYRVLIKEWGLYDPIARTVLRLVEEAYIKLRKLRTENITGEFAAMSPSEQLRHVIVDMLEEWDKISEITEAMRECNSTEELDVVSDLLFQQWRLFCEAFGVSKPIVRSPEFGPHRPEAPEPEPGMELDEIPTKVATIPLTSLMPQ